jgi:predicted nuclease of predicted toxin-antitoxin system
VAPRFLIDENLSPLLARHLRTAHGFDAVHVQELGLRGASDADILARAIAEDRIIMTSNADDFRKLGARTPAHPGLAVMLHAVGRARQASAAVGTGKAGRPAESPRPRAHI